ncbi:PREDICTED: LOB domain-containing protein 38-like [Tarenaya hassleriana]|uniref:LOB domain-containing protein 38-like n=1 Tax=Tarenaya hassleriana TaxID=28532 RepID=UPI00053C92F7|nr:PREDICTED: LOB domain-containing protein 38-like [Tarenaya hassleriana]
MSCNGCRVLRKGCREGCVLRTCLQWIASPEAQGHVTLFLAKFFGRSDLFSFISAVPQPQRPDLIKSLLYEACGRTVNPVDGVVGLLLSGKWRLCEEAVETVLAGGVLKPPYDGSPAEKDSGGWIHHRRMGKRRGRAKSGFRGLGRDYTASCWKEEKVSSSSTTATSFESGGEDDRRRRGYAGEETKLLNLFV